MAEAGGWNVTVEDVERAEQAAKQATKPARGRRAKPREHYQRIALRYLDLASRRRDVLVALADEEGVPRETVRDWVRKATKLGFLAPGRPGRAETRRGPMLNPKEEHDG
jgi:acyl-CoA reductase-like NAD-dependent aldehyde dehydrogenase